MTAPVDEDLSTVNKLVKTRRTHNKVRTGCGTCKIRRKKCDEARPSCLRCTSTGRQCDGYASNPISLPQSTVRTRASVHLHQLVPKTLDRLSESSTVDSKVAKGFYNAERRNQFIPRTPSLIAFTSDVSAHCFDYFRYTTAPQIGSYFGSLIWRDMIVQLAMSFPVVLKAAAAVGAAHQRLNMGISRKAFEFCEISDRLYREATSSFFQFQFDNTDAEGRQSVQTAEIILTTSLILGVFETVQGNHDVSAKFISHGLRTVMNRPMLRHCSEVMYRSYAHYQPHLLMDMFTKMKKRIVEVYGREPHILVGNERGELPRIPLVFAAMEDALDMIYTEVDSILHSPTRLWLDPAARQRAQRTHVSRFLQWSAAFAETLVVNSEWTTSMKRKGLMCRIVRNIGYLVLYLVLYAQSDHPECAAEVAVELELELQQGQVADAGEQGYLPAEPREEETEIDDALIIASHKLWTLINASATLATNLTRMCVLVDDILENGPDSCFEARDEGCDYRFSMETGIGPPRCKTPGPESSTKTRHLVRSLLDPKSRESLSVSSPDGHGAVSRSEIYSLVEILNGIEEHTVLEAAKSSLLFRNINPLWIDIQFLMGTGRVLVRYCRAENESDRKKGKIPDTDPVRPHVGTVWCFEWFEF